jgi:hypothetical protein
MPESDRIKLLQRHIARLEKRLAGMGQLNERFFWARLGTLLAGGLGVFFGFFFGPTRLGWPILGVSVAVFAAIVFWHRRLDRNIARFNLSREYQLNQVARIQLDWERIPLPSAGEINYQHPFGADLNLTGPRSLQHLLDLSVSQGGSRRLRSWLLDPEPDPQRIHAHQAILKELAPRTSFRSRLALNGALVASKNDSSWDGEGLLHWLSRHQPARSLRLWLIFLAGIALLNGLLFVLQLVGGLSSIWIATLILYVVLYMAIFRTLGDVFGDAYHLGRTLERFRAVLAFLEVYPYTPGSHLARLCQPFWSGETKPSSYLRTLELVISGTSLRNNPFIWAPLNLLAPWDLYFAYRLEICQRELSERLPAWLDSWYELEALNSLANFAYLNPGYTYPELPGEQDRPVFTAQQLGHPLLPAISRVCNDFELDQTGEIALVSGSNMSGKSTFLRTLGINLCLAYTGAPVAAAMLRTRPFRLFTCIQVSDSLNDGISYFYAEVRRLRALLDEFRRPHHYPLFFLIDEIFRGTNNTERQIGSQAFVETLVGGNGVGVISTHDLELVRLAERFPQVKNVHFREEVHAERMIFDYKLRPGPSPTTNALKIMQLEGLPVPAHPAG